METFKILVPYWQRQVLLGRGHIIATIQAENEQEALETLKLNFDDYCIDSDTIEYDVHERKLEVEESHEYIPDWDEVEVEVV